MRILITGGTGHLGQAIVSELKRDGHRVRVLARQPHRNPHVEWVTGDLATGAGVRQAVADAEVIIHAATNSPAAQRGRFKLGDFLRSPADVDVTGTAALLGAADQAGVNRFVHVSIVGLERLRLMPYAGRKLEAEQLVRSSNVPWAIVRSTGFYWLLERMFQNLVNQPILALPAHASMAPVDSDEFAHFIVQCAADGWLGERQDFAGPQTLTMIELMQQYLTVRDLHRPIHRAPLPRRIQAAITAGNTSAHARLGTTTWAQWLQHIAVHEHSDLGLAVRGARPGRGHEPGQLRPPAVGDRSRRAAGRTRCSADRDRNRLFGTGARTPVR